MRPVVQYIYQYFRTIDKRLLTIVTILTAVLVFLNYHYGISARIEKNNSAAVKLTSWYGVFGVAFGLPWLSWFLANRRTINLPPSFIYLLLLAPALFSIKMCLSFPFTFSGNATENSYWEHVTYWPLLCIIILSALFITWKRAGQPAVFYGFRTSGISWTPYWLMLLIMVPLVALASTQPDFLAVYPKLQSVAGQELTLPLWKKLLFELSYGSDFLSIETFFRGFLVLGFMKYAGKDVILPMACFYCTIHFGKPLGECISSYFGGMVLGIVVYNTRSIWGGLMVHLGIAWLMEAGGYWGSVFFR